MVKDSLGRYGPHYQHCHVLIFQVVLLVLLLKKEVVCSSVWIQMCPKLNMVLTCLVSEHTFKLLQGKLDYRCCVFVRGDVTMLTLRQFCDCCCFACTYFTCSISYCFLMGGVRSHLCMLLCSNCSQNHSMVRVGRDLWG